MNKGFWILLFAAGALLMVSAFYLMPGTKPQPSEAGPNVVFLLLDTLRADRVDATRNGEAVMPFLSAFARESVYFSKAVTPCSWTKPAMASILTSTYVDVHRVYYSIESEIPERPLSEPLPDSFETMAEYLAEHGYDLWAWQANANLTRELGFAQGYPDNRYIFANGARANHISDAAMNALDQLQAPFFLYLHYMDPHLPFTPPEEVLSLFGEEPELTEADQKSLHPDQIISFLMDQLKTNLGLKAEAAFPPLSEGGRAQLERLYDGECRFLDDNIGPLIRKLQRRFPETIFVILADHGEELAERGNLGHGHTLFEELIHVPFLIQGPGLEARRIDTTVEVLGLLPTLAALLGLPERPQWQGRNLLSPPDGITPPRYSRTKGSWDFLKIDLESVQQGPQKLIVDRSHDRKMLFDLVHDPDERNPLPVEGEEGAALESLLEAHRKENAERATGRVTPMSIPIDPETMEELRALGYGESGPPSR